MTTWLDRLPTPEEVAAHAAAHPCLGGGRWHFAAQPIDDEPGNGWCPVLRANGGVLECRTSDNYDWKPLPWSSWHPRPESRVIPCTANGVPLPDAKYDPKGHAVNAAARREIMRRLARAWEAAPDRQLCSLLFDALTPFVDNAIIILPCDKDRANDVAYIEAIEAEARQKRDPEWG